jgi:O-antigen/teichoic acid export membrane protein
MEINKKDVLWNYAATFLQMGASLILFPFVLRTFPSETIAIWIIFSAVTVLVNLLDFGFNISFMRNVSYVFSGAKKLKRTGFCVVEEEDFAVDYGLLKGLIGVMRFFYSRIAILLCLLLASIGTYYISTVLDDYSGSHSEVYASWVILCIVNSYFFYTLYYDALMLGKGLIKRSKQINIAGQIVYLIAAIIFIQLNWKLIAIVSAQALSVIIKRILAYYSFYTEDMKDHLQQAIKKSQKDILKAIYPNAVKLGLTSLGGFLVNRSAVIIGSLYLSLETIASFGITIQIIGVIAGISTVYYTTYQTQIMQYRVQNNDYEIKQLYLKSCIFLLATYIIGSVGLLYFGDWALNLIGSKTLLLHRPLIAVALLIALLESNHSIAGGILMTKNEVPFTKAFLLFGGITVILLFVFLRYTNLMVWGLILAPGITHVIYNNWKWPYEAFSQLQISKTDIVNSLQIIFKIK